MALVIGLMLLVTAMPVAGAAPKISIEQPAGTPLGTGTVIAWGWNAYGQTNVPIGLSGVRAIAAGFGHNVALKSDGTVVAWGYNGSERQMCPLD